MHHFLLYSLLQATTSTTTAKSKSGSSSYLSLLIIVGIFVVAYFTFLRPRQQRMRQQQGAARQISVGDEVMSAGGIYGRVVALDADQVEVEVAPGVVMTFTRRAISARPQTGPSSPADHDQDHDHGSEPWDDDRPNDDRDDH